MKLSIIRTLDELRPVLRNKESDGLDPVYWVFSDISNGKWSNATILPFGLHGNEFNKTYGHYHGVGALETYKVILGSGVLVLQKHGKSRKDVERVVMIKATAGDQIEISREWGHSWSNTGSTSLITVDDWRSGHTGSDYAEITKLQGMAYYLISSDGGLSAIKNPNYNNLPNIEWLTPEEFKS